MVPRESFINKIRELNYTYKSTQKRTYIWRKKGGTHFISVPMAELLEDEFVFTALKQAGESDASIRAFIASAKG